MNTQQPAKEPIIQDTPRGPEPDSRPEVKTEGGCGPDSKNPDPKNDADDNAPDTVPEVIRLSPEKR